METPKQSIVAHPRGEQPTVEVPSAIADTFAGRIHVEWDPTAPVTPLGQLQPKDKELDLVAVYPPEFAKGKAILGK